VALRTTCIKNVKFKVIKIRTGCQYVGYFYYSENLNWVHKTFDLAAVEHSWPKGLLILKGPIWMFWGGPQQPLTRLWAHV